MTQLRQVYKCTVCGNIVEVLHSGKGQLVCCGKEMELQKENTVDASKEKHVPVTEKVGAKVTVKVGSAPHPMEEKHFIEWVELIAGDKSCRVFLKPGESPEAAMDTEGIPLVARAYCNIHGLWSA